MDYDSAQPGAPIVSNPPLLPASSPTALSNSAGGAGTWDRLEADIKALQQQAVATQKAIQQVNNRETPGPLEVAQAAVPSLSDIGSSLVGASAVLGVTVALLWWYLWIRPQAQLRDAPRPGTQTTPADSATPTPASTAMEAQRTTHAPPIHPAPPGPDSLFARADPNLGFDPEAAATEVVRVRKSLAEKREARALQLEGEDSAPVNSDPIPIPKPMPLPETDMAPDLELHPPLPEPEYASEQDFTITLALAQESEALDLWPEARELATEVLESNDANLRAQAQAMLARLNQLEQALARESVLRPPSAP